MESVRKLRNAAGLSQAELARRIGLSQSNISAYESGARRPSGAMLERIHDACRILPSVAFAAHREEIRRIAADHGVSDVRVFGSAARGTDTVDSDLDLLVRFDDTASLLDLVRLADAMEACLGVSVDIVSDRGISARNHSILRDAVAV